MYLLIRYKTSKRTYSTFVCFVGDFLRILPWHSSPFLKPPFCRNIFFIFVQPTNSRKSKLKTWRIIPFSKWLITTIYYHLWKPIWPFGRGPTTPVTANGWWYFFSLRQGGTLQKTNLPGKKNIHFSWVMLVLLRFLMVPSILHFLFRSSHGAMLGATFFRVVPC